MAVVVFQEIANATREQYDEVIEKMGLTDGRVAPRGIFHVVAENGMGGLTIVDV